MIFNAVILSALAATAFAAPRENQRVVHERRAILDPNVGDRIDGDAIIPIRIGVKQSNLETGYDAVMDVSDPESANYGKHWTLEQVREHFAPTEASIEAVVQWLTESGIDREQIGHSEDKAWIGINIPAKHAEELLSTEYHEHHAKDGTRIGCDEYSLPLNVSRHVDYIKPGVSLSPPVQKRQYTRRDLTDIEKRDENLGSYTSKNPGAVNGRPGMRPMPEAMAAAAAADSLANCDTLITPACIRALYNIPMGSTNVKNAFGVLEFTPDVYAQGDLNLFFQRFAPYVPQGTSPKLVSITGGRAPTTLQNAGPESDIDFDLAISLTYPQKVTLYQVGTNYNFDFTTQEQLNEVTFLLPFLDAIDGSFCTSADRRNGFQCGGAKKTKVISISYGNGEVFMGQNAVVRTCNEIMKLSLQGSTFVVSSGDYGVATFPDTGYNGCINKNYNLDISGTIFNPDFPVGCPYVLAVGGTQLNQGESVNDPEYVLYQPGLSSTGGATFSSGGGFSNYFTRPSYQASAVNGYLAKYVPPYKSYVYNGNDIYSGNSNIGAKGGLYNRAGRAYPDVSANGANLGTYIMGSGTLTYGTSLSAPIVASILTIINNDRAKAGQPPVGFVNPVFYANPGAFIDITRGTNPGCGTQGFPASPGWDPSTGLGTPNFPALQQVFSAAAAGHYKA